MTPKDHKMWRMSQRQEEFKRLYEEKEKWFNETIQSMRDGKIRLSQMNKDESMNHISYKSIREMQTFVKEEYKQEAKNKIKSISEVNFCSRPMNTKIMIGDKVSAHHYYFSPASLNFFHKYNIKLIGQICMLREFDIFSLGINISTIEEICEVLGEFGLKLDTSEDEAISMDVVNS
jgi:hypothetical protein